MARSRSCIAVIALGLCGALAACGGRAPAPSANAGTGSAGSAAGSAQPPAPPPLDRDYPRLAERAVQLYEAVAAAFAAAGEDCAQATATLGALTTEYAPVVAANAKVLHEGRARELRPALAKHSDRLDAAAQAIVQSPTMAKCSQDPAFTRAFDDLVGAPP